MPEDILINITPQETRVALVDAGVVQELHVEREAGRGLVGNICIGRVARVLPGMQSAFVDIGLERAAFLHIADIFEHRGNGDAGKPITRPPIERVLAEGQPLMVQVVKDPIGTKGARLSTQISLAGRLLAYLPQDPHIGISQRIEREEERKVLRERMQTVVPAEEKGGFIVRTMAESASQDELKADVDYLRRLWQDIRTRAAGAVAPSMLYQDLSLAQRVLRDLAHSDTGRVVVDSRENFVKLQAFAQDYTQSVHDKIEHYVGERPLFELYNIDEEIERALSRRVDLKSGGYLIIDQTEAMTTIDVNTGSYLGTRNLE
ncbi:MAG: Rne/Rng family ribonuclease, partial [Burkholderiales bacterium]